MKNLLSMTIVDQIIGAAPFVYEGDFAEGIYQAEALGYDGVELHLTDPAKVDITHIKQALQESGLHLTAIGTGRAYVNEGLSLSCIEADMRQTACARLCSFIDLAAELGGVVIIGCMRGNVGPNDSLTAAISRLTESMQEIDAYAGTCGVRLVFEPINRYENNFLPTVESVADFIEEAGLKHTGILIDSFHMNIEERSFSAAIAQYSDKIWYAHMADSNRMYPGGGHLDFPAILSALTQAGYNGPFSAECQPKPDKATAAAAWLSAMRQLLQETCSGKPETQNNIGFTQKQQKL